MNAQRYAAVPAALPGTLPAMTRDDCQRIATLIVRKFWPGRMGRHYQFPDRKVRRVWVTREPTSAHKASKGLGRLIHDLSHDVFKATYPHKLPHDPLHAKYETDIAAFVAGSAWLRKMLAPKPAKVVKPKPTADEKRNAELLRIAHGILRWEAKARRAENALKKLRARQRRVLRLARANQTDGSAKQ